MYVGNPWAACAGCGRPAQGSMHIIPQAVAKANGQTELCWLEENILPACHNCNRIAENPSDPKIKKLFCYDKILEVTEKYDQERYQKLIV